MKPKNKTFIYKGAEVFIQGKFRAKDAAGERPLAPMDYMDLLFNHAVRTEEDLKRLGELFTEDE